MPTYYVALFTAGAELDHAAYARKPVVIAMYEGSMTNAATVTWGRLTETWPANGSPVIEAKLFAALAGGDPVHAGQLAAPVFMLAENHYQIPAGAIRLADSLPAADPYGAARWDEARWDEALLDGAASGGSGPAYDLMPVELLEVTPPAPSDLGVRVMAGARRTT